MSLKDKKAAQEAKDSAAQEATSEAVDTQEAPAETKEVAVKEPAGAVATSTPPPSAFVTHPAMVEAAANSTYRSFKSIVASNGTHMISQTDIDLGKTINFQAILASDVMKVTPGSTDEEALDYFQVSNDGVYVADGRTLQEAKDDAIEAGYTKTTIKKYVDVICIITESTNEEYIGEIVRLQLSPSSQFTWGPLSTSVQMKAAMGQLKAEPVAGNAELLGTAVVFTSTATPTSWKGNNFTKFEFSLA